MKNTIIKFQDVTKEFRLNKQKTFKEFLPALFGGKETVSKFNALEDISFEVQEGETLGIIGPNGSGKSTILKLIAGVTSPTKGIVNVKGSVSPLIELGAGFHGDLTGKENVFINGSILGLSQKELHEKYQSILKFAELEEFINQPIKRFSSGMYMRLGFSIAIHVNPKILIIDEILAVGDEKFQQKCFKKMEEFKKDGVTIIFVSHNIEQVKNFCSKVIYLKNSKIINSGQPEKICNQYIKDITHEQA